MYLSGSKNAPYLMIEPDSDLNNVNSDFLKNNYLVRLFGVFPDQFIERFITIFKDVEFLDVGMQLGASKSFIYEFCKLKGLVIPLFRDDDFILDCKKLPKSLAQLHINVYNPGKLINLNAINSNLERLTITDFNEKDLKKLSFLTELKSLSFLTARIKSLAGIEQLTNLRVLSLGGVRSLIDISYITSLQNLKYLEFDICWKLVDFSSIGELKELEVLRLMDCKNLATIKFIEKLPKLRQIYTLGTTVINDFNTLPAKNVSIFFGSLDKRYNKHYPEKEIKEGQKSASDYL